MHGTVGIMLEHLGYIVCRIWGDFTLVGKLSPCSSPIVSFLASNGLLLATMVTDDHFMLISINKSNAWHENLMIVKFNS